MTRGGEVWRGSGQVLGLGELGGCRVGDSGQRAQGMKVEGLRGTTRLPVAARTELQMLGPLIPAGGRGQDYTASSGRPSVLTPALADPQGDNRSVCVSPAAPWGRA